MNTKLDITDKAKLEASVLRQRELLTEIADLALAAEAKSCNANVQLGSKWLDNSKAICKIRQLCELPNSPDSRSEAKKPTMDFGRFHVTRAAIPCMTILTFRRKRELLPEFGTVVPGRIIVAKITREDVKAEKPAHCFTVMSYAAGENPRVLFTGHSWVCMSKTEKMVYRMVKCDIKETQRRHISRKRARAAVKANATRKAKQEGGAK